MGAFCAQAQQISTTFRPQHKLAQPFLDPQLAPFYHGVASGDPLADRVVIWTRVTPPDGHSSAPISGTWHVYRDLALTQPVTDGSFTTDANRDYTVKVDVTGLQPDTYYYYNFRALDSLSIIGRTRTAPSGPAAQLRLAILSCTDYRKGFFTPLGLLADRNDIDLVLRSNCPT
jgi:alkaline phosphatase D